MPERISAQNPPELVCLETTCPGRSTPQPWKPPLSGRCEPPRRAIPMKSNSKLKVLAVASAAATEHSFRPGSLGKRQQGRDSEDRDSAVQVRAVVDSLQPRALAQRQRPQHLLQRRRLAQPQRLRK